MEKNQKYSGSILELNEKLIQWEAYKDNIDLLYDDAFIKKFKVN